MKVIKQVISKFTIIEQKLISILEEKDDAKKIEMMSAILEEREGESITEQMRELNKLIEELQDKSKSLITLYLKILSDSLRVMNNIFDSNDA